MELIICILSVALSYFIVRYSITDEYPAWQVKLCRWMMPVVSAIFCLIFLLVNDYSILIAPIVFHVVFLAKRLFKWGAKKTDSSNSDSINDFFVSPKESHRTSKSLNSHSENTYVAFKYTNAEGLTALREVDVKAVDNIYLKGYCHSRNAIRTFRIDRIKNDEIVIRHTGEVVSVDAWITSILSN